MSGYLFFSHDGYGLGHVRRNTLIAQALKRSDPGASIVLVTGIPARPGWLDRCGCRIVQVPPLLKDGRGAYRPVDGTSFQAAVTRRSEIFAENVDRARPDVVVVDRHPFGTAGELRGGLETARRRGALLVLGLRDILDEPGVVREELAGDGWADVPQLFSQTLVYGRPHLCDHRAEYGLPMRPLYCGWVTEPSPPAARDPALLVAAAGGGGDGGAVFRMAVEVLLRRPAWTGEIAAGPFADVSALRREAAALDGRVTVHEDVDGCAPLFARAGTVIQMAGYNSTFEALAAGHRSVLVPRRAPRREQAIRAERLAALGLADVVQEGAAREAVDRVLETPRHLTAGALAAAGINLDGAERAAAHLHALARQRRAA